MKFLVAASTLAIASAYRDKCMESVKDREVNCFCNQAACGLVEKY